MLEGVSDDAVVEVESAEEGVASRGHYFEHLVADLNDRQVECATTEVEDRQPLSQVSAQSVGQCSGRRLVEDPQYVEAGLSPCLTVLSPPQVRFPGFSLVLLRFSSFSW